MRLLLFSLLLFLGCGLFAEDSSSRVIYGAGEEVPADATVAATEESVPWAQLAAMLGLVGACGGLAWWVHRQRSRGLGTVASREGLRVVETRSLGSRQFLVVVDYGDERSLLGVGPGFINFLRPLPKEISRGSEVAPEETPRPEPPRSRIDFSRILAGKETTP